MVYIPTTYLLDRYADILVNFALYSGSGVKKGEVVLLQVPECAKPLLISLRRAVLKAGAHPLIHYLPDNISREFYTLTNDEQLHFFPASYFKGIVDQIDHRIFIIAETQKRELEGIDPQRIMSRSEAFKPYKEWLEDKEKNGKMTWTLALYGTEAMAAEAGMDVEEYWDQIIQACYLDVQDPIGKWKEIFEEVGRIKNSLNALKIEKLRVQSVGTDLMIWLGKYREWMGGSGRNIPSFEVFISPDYRMTEGYITFNQPLYRYGNLIKDVYLVFKNGKVVEASATEGENILKEMIRVKGADQVGEYSLTDARLSRITRFMGETLYDENIGGANGNTHIALGSAYKESYPGEKEKISKDEWDEMGYNDSVVHTDIVSTEDRKVTAYLTNGKEKVIYEHGKFSI